MTAAFADNVVEESNSEAFAQSFIKNYYSSMYLDEEFDDSNIEFDELREYIRTKINYMQFVTSDVENFDIQMELISKDESTDAIYLAYFVEAEYNYVGLDTPSGFGECVNCGATICAIRHITTRAAGIISTIPAKSITSAAVGLAMGAGSWTYWLRESQARVNSPIPRISTSSMLFGNGANFRITPLRLINAARQPIPPRRRASIRVLTVRHLSNIAVNHRSKRQNLLSLPARCRHHKRHSPSG